MNNQRFSRLVASRYLWARRGEAFITIISVISIVGVAVGVAVLNMVMSIMGGFQHELREKIVGTNSHILVRSLNGRIVTYEAIEKELSGVPGVTSTSMYTYNQGLIRARGNTSGVLVRGIKANGSASKRLRKYMQPDPGEYIFSLPEVNGERGEGADLPRIIVGAELLRTLGLFKGDIVSILSPSVSSSPFGLVPRYKRFVVSGIYSSGLVEYESSLIYMELEQAQRFFRLGDAVSGFEVQVDDIDAAPAIASQLQSNLGGFKQTLYTQDWTVTNKPLWDALRLEKKVYFFVLLLIILMASFSIITTLIMIVLEKRKDIAVLRTLGASSNSIAAIFLFQGAVVGATGTICGTFAGYLGCLALRRYKFPLDQKIFPVDSVPVHMDMVSFVLVAVCAFLICFLATIYPARRAAAMDPGQALRYE